MSVTDVLNELARRGVTLRVDGGEIIAKPLSIVDDNLRQAVKAHKVEILALLTQSCPSCGSSLRMQESDTCRYIECPAVPIHYFELIDKRPGQPTRLAATYEKSDVQRSRLPTYR